MYENEMFEAYANSLKAFIKSIWSLRASEDSQVGYVAFYDPFLFVYSNANNQTGAIFMHWTFKSGKACVVLYETLNWKLFFSKFHMNY